MNLLTIAALSLLGAPGQKPAVSAGVGATAERNTCVECHRQLGGPLGEPVRAMLEDIHQQRGLSCAGCHGGDPARQDPTLAMDPRRGFIGKPKPQEIPRFCGKCHSNTEFMKKFNPSPRVDQVAEYYTSVHGKRLRQGDQKVASCVSCHGYHGVKPVDNPAAPVYPLHVAETCGKCHASAAYMRPYSIPVNQVEEYKKSIHAESLFEKQDLSSPTCNDCHGNHGAAPPGVDSVANVCGTCHSRQSDLFQKSPHQPAFAAMQIAGCVVCHGNHEVRAPADAMLGVGEKSVCVRCHSAGDAGYEAAKQMRASIDELALRLKAAERLLQQAASAGMEVSRTRFELNEARTRLIDARVVVHSFSPGELQEVVKPGLAVAAKAYQAGQDAMAEFHFRRKGLAASLIFICLAVLAIYLKVRRIETRS